MVMTAGAGLSSVDVPTLTSNACQKIRFIGIYATANATAFASTLRACFKSANLIQETRFNVLATLSTSNSSRLTAFSILAPASTSASSLTAVII